MVGNWSKELARAHPRVCRPNCGRGPSRSGGSDFSRRNLRSPQLAATLPCPFVDPSRWRQSPRNREICAWKNNYLIPELWNEFRTDGNLPAERGEALLEPGEKAEIGCNTGRHARIGPANVKPNEEDGHQVGQRVDPVDHEHHADLHYKLILEKQSVRSSQFSLNYWPKLTPKKETHRLDKCEYQLADLRPMLTFLCCRSLTGAAMTTSGEPTWLAGAVGRSSPGTGLVGDKLCSLCQ